MNSIKTNACADRESRLGARASLLVELARHVVRIELNVLTHHHLALKPASKIGLELEEVLARRWAAAVQLGY